MLALMIKLDQRKADTTAPNYTMNTITNANIIDCEKTAKERQFWNMGVPVDCKHLTP
jgi:hypothetical protein